MFLCIVLCFDHIIQLMLMSSWPLMAVVADEDERHVDPCCSLRCCNTTGFDFGYNVFVTVHTHTPYQGVDVFPQWVTSFDFVWNHTQYIRGTKIGEDDEIAGLPRLLCKFSVGIAAYSAVFLFISSPFSFLVFQPTLALLSGLGWGPAFLGLIGRASLPTCRRFSNTHL